MRAQERLGRLRHLYDQHLRALKLQGLSASAVLCMRMCICYFRITESKWGDEWLHTAI